MKSIENEILRLFQNPGLRDAHLFGNRMVKDIESWLRRYYQKEFVVMFPNATTAIWALCFALDIRNKTVLATPFGWGGAVSPFLYLNNKILFGNPDSLLNLDSDSVNLDQISVDGIFSVDIGGFPSETKRLNEMTKEKDVFLIADASQSFGSYRDGKPAGYFADAVVLSFTSTKNVNCLEGGAILTDDKNIYEGLLSVSQHPYRQASALGLDGVNEFSPLNGRINPLSALILSTTLDDQLITLRNHQKKFFTLYERLIADELIKTIPNLTKPEESTYFDFLVEPVFVEDKMIDNLNKTHPDFQFSLHTPVPFFAMPRFERDFYLSYYIGSNSKAINHRLRIKLKTKKR